MKLIKNTIIKAVVFTLTFCPVLIGGRIKELLFKLVVEGI